MLFRIVWHFGGQQDENLKISWNQLSAKFGELAELCDKFPDLADEDPTLPTLCRRAGGLYDSRNDWIHGMVSQASLASVNMIRWKGLRNRQEKQHKFHLWSWEVPLQDLMDLAVASKAFADEFHDFEVRWTARWPLPPGAIITEPPSS